MERQPPAHGCGHRECRDGAAAAAGRSQPHGLGTLQHKVWPSSFTQRCSFPCTLLYAFLGSSAVVPVVEAGAIVGGQEFRYGARVGLSSSTEHSEPISAHQGLVLGGGGVSCSAMAASVHKARKEWGSPPMPSPVLCGRNVGSSRSFQEYHTRWLLMSLPLALEAAKAMHSYSAECPLCSTAG